LRWVFLGGGSIPLGVDEDDPAVTAVAATAVDEHDGTYEIPNRCVGFINACMMFNPHELGDTSMRWGYGGKPVDGPVSL
jgi:hypothetical protein